MAGALHKPKMKSFWRLVRRLLRCTGGGGGGNRYKNRPPEPGEEEQRSLLTPTSLGRLLALGAGDGAAVRPCALQCGKNGGPGSPGQPAARPEAAAGRDGGGDHRRFRFVGFRRRLLRRPWRPMLVAIPE